MIVEFGHLALIIALCLSLVLGIVPILGSYCNRSAWMAMGSSVAIGHFLFLLLSFICLTAAFIQDDFSVRYVANNSNTLLPVYYKISAVWGAHEGSMLLWVLILALWMAAVVFSGRRLPPQLTARVLSIMGMIALGFELFLLFTSNPFERILPFSPSQGADLNPLLQDIGLIIHPPLLYMGYVGFSVPFAFAIAALLGGQFDSAWARWVRPWTNSAWVFLTVGITLGSWWAYYELGWGGWWFWDPVENASFMPWLAGGALVHSLSVTEKRGIFRSWTLLLAIFAFSLSLLGTFLVRSGVLTSVHAFASDPTRGVFILIFLGVVIGGSLLLFGLRGPAMQTVGRYSLISREMLLLGNNLLLVTALAMILIGTLYPLVADVLNLGKISVGPPYFNFFFVPLMLALLLLLGLSAASRWKKTRSAQLLDAAKWPLPVSIILGLSLPLVLAENYSWVAALTMIVVLWVFLTSCKDVYQKTRNAENIFIGLRRLSGSYWGMILAHVGIAVCALGVGLSSAYSVQRDLRMSPGDSAEVGGYQFAFQGVERVPGHNYLADRGRVLVSKNNHQVVQLYPEKRNYMASGQVMTEAAIDGALHRDIYVSLGEPLAEGSWAVRLYVKPFVRCIWLGGLLIALGGILAIMDKRYRRRREIAYA